MSYILLGIILSSMLFNIECGRNSSGNWTFGASLTIGNIKAKKKEEKK